MVYFKLKNQSLTSSNLRYEMGHVTCCMPSPTREYPQTASVWNLPPPVNRPFTPKVHHAELIIAVRKATSLLDFGRWVYHISVISLSTFDTQHNQCAFNVEGLSHPRSLDRWGCSALYVRLLPHGVPRQRIVIASISSHVHEAIQVYINSKPSTRI